jgi:hypothetical protein
MAKGDLGEIHWQEFFGVITMTASIGIIRVLLMIRRGRKVKLVDWALEPSLSTFGGLCIWGFAEVTSLPDVVQAVLTSLGAWGGIKLIHKLEVKYFGGSRFGDLDPLEPRTGERGP